MCFLLFSLKNSCTSVILSYFCRELEYMSIRLYLLSCNSCWQGDGQALGRKYYENFRWVAARNSHSCLEQDKNVSYDSFMDLGIVWKQLNIILKLLKKRNDVEVSQVVRVVVMASSLRSLEKNFQSYR